MPRTVHVHVFLLVAVWSIIALAGGCASTSQVTDPYAFRVLAGVDSATALARADAALANLGYAIELRDPDRGVIETLPVSGATRDSDQPRVGSSRRGADRMIARRIGLQAPHLIRCLGPRRPSD